MLSGVTPQVVSTLTKKKILGAHRKIEAFGEPEKFLEISQVLQMPIPDTFSSFISEFRKKPPKIHLKLTPDSNRIKLFLWELNYW